MISHMTLFGTAAMAWRRRSRRKKPRRSCERSAGQGHCALGWGTRQALGYPPARYDLALSTAKLNRITDYQPADLTVTAQAGVTMAQLQEVWPRTASFCRWMLRCPTQQTLGGIVAARADSLRRLACGSVRDSLLGVSVINRPGRAGQRRRQSRQKCRGIRSAQALLRLVRHAGTDRGGHVQSRAAARNVRHAAAAGRRTTTAKMFWTICLAPILHRRLLFLLNPARGRHVLPEAEDAQYVVAWL